MNSDQAMPVGKIYGLTTIAEFELGQNIVNVIPDRVVADNEPLCYLIIGGVGGHNSQNFHLAIR